MEEVQDNPSRRANTISESKLLTVSSSSDDNDFPLGSLLSKVLMGTDEDTFRFCPWSVVQLLQLADRIIII